jgi:hypothetical protein
MNISKKDLEWAASQDLLSSVQADQLWKRLEANQAQQPHFSAAHVAYYFGAMIVISAMGWFMTLAWENLGGPGIFVIATIYAVCFSLAGRTLWQQKAFQIPGGLLFTIAVCLVPLAIYGLEKWAGFWPQDTPASYRDYHVYVKGSWIVMELATILAGVIALRFVPFPFLTAPIAFSLWYMSMDLTPILFGVQDFSWEERRWVSVWFGLTILLASYLADRRTEKDYAFWGYLFGLLAFWGGLSFMDSDSHWTKAVYCLINLGLMIASVLLGRRVFIVFGALGVFGYLGYLSYHVFENSVVFPFALTILGVGIIFLGIQYQKNGERIQSAILARLPRALIQRLPQERTRRNAVSP